jgi:hypothetical protein
MDNQETQRIIDPFDTFDKAYSSHQKELWFFLYKQEELLINLIPRCGVIKKLYQGIQGTEGCEYSQIWKILLSLILYEQT